MTERQPYLYPVSFGISSDVVDEETRAQDDCELKVIFMQPLIVSLCTFNYRGVVNDSPNSRCIGLSIHQPSSTRNGIQNNVNWMLRSMARALAREEGTRVSFPRRWLMIETTK